MYLLVILMTPATVILITAMYVGMACQWQWLPTDKCNDVAKSGPLSAAWYQPRPPEQK